jgi:hypothetical protein
MSDDLENLPSSCPQKKEKARLPREEQKRAGQKSAEEAQGAGKKKAFRLVCAVGA